MGILDINVQIKIKCVTPPPPTIAPKFTAEPIESDMNPSESNVPTIVGAIVGVLVVVAAVLFYVKYRKVIFFSTFLAAFGDISVSTKKSY